MIKGIGRGFAWWVEGLVDALAAAQDRLRRRQRLRLVRAGGGYVVQNPDGKRLKSELRLEAGPTGEPELAPAAPANELTGHDVDVVLAPDEVLVRSLDPLPQESRPYLDGIVRHHLERLTPWRSDDVLYAYRAAPVSATDARLAVTVIATARSIHSRLLAALRAVKATELRLLYADPDSARALIPIPIDGNAFAVARRARLRSLAVTSLGVAGLAMVAGIGILAYAWNQADEEIAAADEAIAEVRRSLAGGGPRTPVAGRDLDAVLARKRITPAAVLALDGLSNVLPDGTWLTELRLNDGRVRMVGVSRNVAGLVPLIASAPGFADATFFAPTTRLPDGQGDRFHLEARLLPPKQGPK